ncbi:hypothetical protein [Paenibacillus popilliae]|uniref:Lipoprotein n=1 Tax=Paenibacillus popilliae ATCC 14706 TaxID=1212764 RepID=M9M791_PAEPP|nr:hypothetical protein [Paenibacillus popilliae]GAC43543.1 hypothetical protein PPOP_2926 [Paenibacillus popilliae ATCC 14706]
MRIFKYCMLICACFLFVSCSHDERKNIITISHLKEDSFDYMVDVSEVKATSISFYIDYYKNGTLLEKREEITGHPIDNNNQAFIYFHFMDTEKNGKKDYWIWESKIEKKYGQSEKTISEYKKSTTTSYKKTFIPQVSIGKDDIATIGYIEGKNNDELYVLRCIIN